MADFKLVITPKDGLLIYDYSEQNFGNILLEKTIRETVKKNEFNSFLKIFSDGQEFIEKIQESASVEYTEKINKIYQKVIANKTNSQKIEECTNNLISTLRESYKFLKSDFAKSNNQELDEYNSYKVEEFNISMLKDIIIRIGKIMKDMDTKRVNLTKTIETLSHRFANIKNFGGTGVHLIRKTLVRKINVLTSILYKEIVEINNEELNEAFEDYIYILEECFPDYNPSSVNSCNFFYKIGTGVEDGRIYLCFELLAGDSPVKKIFSLDYNVYLFNINCIYLNSLEHSDRMKQMICEKYGFDTFSDHNLWVSANIFILVYVASFMMSVEMDIIKVSKSEYNFSTLFSKERIKKYSQMIKTKRLNKNIEKIISLGLNEYWF